MALKEIFESLFLLTDEHIYYTYQCKSPWQQLIIPNEGRLLDITSSRLLLFVLNTERLDIFSQKLPFQHLRSFRLPVASTAIIATKDRLLIHSHYSICSVYSISSNGFSITFLYSVHISCPGGNFTA